MLFRTSFLDLDLWASAWLVFSNNIKTCFLSFFPRWCTQIKHPRLGLWIFNPLKIVSSMSTPILFKHFILGFPARSFNKNGLKASASFVKWSIDGPKKTGLFPFASFRILLFLSKVPVSCKSQRMKVVSIAKGTGFLSLQQDFSMSLSYLKV